MAFALSTITGDKQIQRQLRALAGPISRRAMASGISASLTSLGKSMRSAINATNASADLKREARRSIGKRFKRGGTSKMGVTTAQVAKVGFKVAKKQAKTNKDRMSRSGGVGIGISNIHWFVLGTDERSTKAGRPTGKIEDVFGKVTEQVMASSGSAALAAARNKIGQVILREAAKRR